MNIQSMLDAWYVFILSVFMLSGGLALVLLQVFKIRLDNVFVDTIFILQGVAIMFISVYPMIQAISYIRG